MSRERFALPAALLTVLVCLVMLLPSTMGSPGTRSQAPPVTSSHPADAAGPARPPLGLAPPMISSSAPRGSPSSGSSDTLVSGACGNVSNSGIQQAADPSGQYLYEVWNGCGGLGFAVSSDGGSTFSNASMLPLCGYDPSDAVAPNGTLYLAYISTCSGGPSPYLVSSGDHGRTFSAPTRVLPNGTNSSMRSTGIAIAPGGEVELLWIGAANATNGLTPCPPTVCTYGGENFDAFFSESSSGGRSWTPATSLNTARELNATLSASIVIAPDGSTSLLLEVFALVGTSLVVDSGGFYLVQLPNGSLTPSPRSAVSDLSAPDWDGAPDGSIGIDRSGSLYAAFDANVGGRPAVSLVASQDSGGSWGTPNLLDRSSNDSARTAVTVLGEGSGAARVAWLANTSALGGWAAYGAYVWGNGAYRSLSAPLSNGTGDAGSMAGADLSLVDLGAGVSSVAWAFNVSGPLPVTGPSLQVFETRSREALPAAPTIGGLTSGPATLVVRWNPPLGNASVTGYAIGWGTETPTWLALVGPTTFTYAVGGLLPSVKYVVAVRAFNDAGNGPASPSIGFELTAWSIVAGTLTPSSATLTLDGLAVPVVAGAYRVNTTYGAHLLEAMATGYQTQPAAFSAPWNATIFENLTLARDPGSVSGFVTPWNATLTWDGLRLPTHADGSYRVNGTAGTTHVIAASLHGYSNASRTVTVPDLSVLWSNLSLAPIYGQLVLWVLPHNATVMVNGTAVSLNASGGVRVSLYPGTYRVLARAPGYSAGNASVAIVAGAIAHLTLNLSIAPPNPTTSSANLGALATYGALAGLALAAAVAALWWYRRRLPPPGPPVRPPGSEELYGDEPRPTPETPPELSEGGELPREDAAVPSPPAGG